MYATVIARVVCEAQGTDVTISFLLHFEDVAFPCCVLSSDPNTYTHRVCAIRSHILPTEVRYGQKPGPCE